MRLLEQLTATRAITILETFKTHSKSMVNTAWRKCLLASENFENLALPSRYVIILFELSPFQDSHVMRFLRFFDLNLLDNHKDFFNFFYQDSVFNHKGLK